MGKTLNLESPTTFNEKLQWLKLYDHNEIYPTIVDKYAVRQFVKERIGEEYLIPLCGGPWKKFDEIDFGTLPDSFVLKTTHDSGGVFLCREKNSIDIKKAKGTINASLRTNYYRKYREWPYNLVPRQIIAEAFIGDKEHAPVDYKIFCFDGVPKFLFVATGRYVDTRFDFFDMDFHAIPLKQGHENSSTPIAKTENYDKMVEIAKKLSKGFQHVRVDLYNINGKIYFGEMTLYNYAGLIPFDPEEYDTIFGEYLHIEELIAEKNKKK